MYQQSTAGAGCLGCGLGSVIASVQDRGGISTVGPGTLQATSLISSPGVRGVIQAIERGDIVLPDPEQQSTTDTYALDEPGAPGMPMWVYGVAGVGILTLVGGGIWWLIKRGEGEESEE